ncbi:MAG: hypothetical protein CVU69_13205 [Deltaproteobacteria bacterium HGW-Deltaproteobacteria-4]|nr:MAG: hypothetical protein CVU69_13205 [Deltaproteobacteria bacterium HGW-Deltaproteobacteria-4]
MKSVKTLLFAALLTSLALLQGCGSSSDDNSVATTTISGSVVAAPVAGASVLVKDSAGATVAGPVTSLDNGTYTINIPTNALSSELHFEATGGTFTDEATGNVRVPATKLATCIAGGTLTTTPVVHIDPASTIIQGLVSNGTPLNKAKNAFNMAFGFIPEPSIAPNTADATNLHQRLAALRAAAFSQLTQDLGLAPEKQFSLLLALSKDLADGTLDGNDASGSVNIDTTTPLPGNTKAQFTTALESMRTRDFSDVTSVQLGRVTAYTHNYKVEVVNPDGINSAKLGKTSFTLKLTNRSDDTPAIGQNIKLIPYMHMASKDHSSPADAVTDNGDGTYSCTIYYLMMTMMATQEYWELQVKINDTETVTFFPNVGMAMGTSLVKLYGTSADMVANKDMPPAKRTYLLFKDSVNVATNTFSLFLATRDDAMMMKFPAVSGDSTLTDSTGTTWNVVPATSSVQISTDNVSYFNATDNGGGHWSATNPGLTLTPGATVYVKVTINGEVKTDLAGTTDYATFTLPSM